MYNSTMSIRVNKGKFKIQEGQFIVARSSPISDYYCSQSFTYQITSPGYTTIPLNYDMVDSFGNAEVTISSSTFNEVNEIFVGLTSGVGELFSFSSGENNSTKTVGLYSPERNTKLIISVYSNGTADLPFQPFELFFSASCPTCIDCPITPNPQNNLCFCIGSGFDNSVNALEIYSEGSLIAGGNFTTYNTVINAPRVFIVNFDGSPSGSNFGDGFGNTVETIAVQTDGKILAGGRFTSYKESSNNYIVRINPDTSKDNTFNIGEGFNNLVQKIVLQPDGKILVGGFFTSYSGITANRLIRLNSDGTKDNTFNIGSGFNNAVYNMVVQPNGKIICVGAFKTFNGNTAELIVRLNSDGSRDNTFNMGSGIAGTLAEAIALQSDGKIIVAGGNLIQYDNTPIFNIVRLETDGTVDFTFLDSCLGFTKKTEAGTIHTVEVQPDGKILVGGDFNHYGLEIPIPPNISRLLESGQIDTSFQVPENGANDKIFDIKYDGTNNIIFAGGQFTSYGGITFNRLLALYPSGQYITCCSET